MAAHGQSVYNINLFLKLRLLFGYYSNICESSTKRLLLKLAFIALAIYSVCVVGLCKKNYYNFSPSLARVLEHVAYVFIAIQTEEKYLLEFYSNNIIIDDRKYAKRVYRRIPKILLAYLVSILIIFTVFFLTLFLTDSKICEASHWNFFQMVYLRTSNEMGRLPVVLIFVLFYARVVVFCTKVRDEVLKSSSAFEWTEYIEIYVELKHVLQETDWPLKFKMVLHLVVGFINILSLQYNLYNYKRTLPFDKKIDDELKVVYVSNLTVFLIVNYATVFFPSFIMEVVLEKMDTLKIEIADKMVTCIDEMRRRSLRKLLTCLREKPLQYTIWRAVTVEATLPLAYISLSATSFVCLLQFSYILD